MRRLKIAFGLLFLVGCNLAAPDRTARTPLPTATLLFATPTPWQTLAPGLEQRIYLPNDNVLSQIVAVRIDPAQYTFRVHYRPGAPLNIAEWRDALPDAVGLVNANFFNPQRQALGLLVADGIVYGTPYTAQGGFFAVENGQPFIRPNPYTGEVLEQAAQAFPLLVQNGEAALFDTSRDRVTRRTAVAIDAQGRVVLLATPLIGIRLDDLSVFLVESDLELVTALNLDGGGSTMMLVRPLDYTLFSRDPVPSVLAVYPR